METQTKTVGKTTKTIGEAISEKVNEYKFVYEALKRAGNKNPARNTLSEAWLELYKAQAVMQKLQEMYDEEAKQEKQKEESQ